MVNARNAVIFGLLLAIGAFAFFHYFESDEAKIKGRFDQLRVDMQKDPAETELVAAAKARRIGRMFTNPCFLNLPSHSVFGTYSRNDLMSHIMAARSQYQSISMRFYDFTIEMLDDETAAVSFTVIAQALPRGDAGELPYEEVQELTCMLKQSEGEWFFSESEAVDVLKR